MRKNGTLNFIIGDHLGSTSIVTDATGAVINETKHKACPLTSFGMLREGEVRYSSGAEQTKYTYTGQYSYTSDFGLMFYNARWYDSSLGRFAQADSVIPTGVQGYDRYAAMNNNPVRYTDPSGHMVKSDADGAGCSGQGPKCIMDMYYPANDDEGMNDSLRHFIIRHPDYTPTNDPELFDEEKFIISTVMFHVALEYRNAEDIIEASGLLSFFGIIVSGINLSPDDEGGGGTPRRDIIQYGGHTIKQSTLDRLGVNRADLHEALRLIRKEYRLPNSFHGNITANGDYINPANGIVLGNIHNYIP